MISNNYKRFFQAILFGIITVLIGLIMSYVFDFLTPTLPDTCSKWDTNYVMEITFFFTGFTLRFLLENDIGKKYLNSTS
jgi:hypothetical protein